MRQIAVDECANNTATTAARGTCLRLITGRKMVRVHQVVLVTSRHSDGPSEKTHQTSRKDRLSDRNLRLNRHGLWSGNG